MLLTGNIAANVDAKGRLALPVHFRDPLTTAGEATVVITADPRSSCLLLYSVAEFERVAEQLLALPNITPGAAHLQRTVVGSAGYQSIDGSGRVLIPPSLRERIAIGRKATLIGLVRKIEIWDAETWTRHDAEAATDECAAEIAEIAANVRI